MNEYELSDEQLEQVAAGKTAAAIVGASVGAANLIVNAKRLREARAVAK